MPSLSIVREVRVLEYEFVYHADVRCYWCGHQAGLVTSKAPFGQPGRSIAFQSRGGDAAVVRTLAEIRCTRCNGPVFADNPEKRRVYAAFEFRQRRVRRPKVARQDAPLP